MKKEVIALAFSDIHLNNWTKFNQMGVEQIPIFDFRQNFQRSNKTKDPSFLLWGFGTYSRNNQYGVIY